jgi:integrating conjugative element relaxase (TIGR03760 family)
MLWPHKQNLKLGPDCDPKKDIRPVLTAEELLAPQHRQVLMQEIQSLLSIPARHYRVLFEVAISNYARFVQELPASEVHHHPAPGGMLEHGLEVTKGALAIRRGHMLPPGAEPETLARKADRWTYAVFTGALMHDVGKPVVDQAIKVLNRSRKPLGQWIPWNGPMAADHYYHMDFVRPRRYGLHPRIGPLLAHHIIPAIGLAWLSEDQELFEPWVCLISGDFDSAGILGQIIREADSRSVARNLGAGETGRFPTATTKPLHEKLLTGLRYLICEGHLPLNRNGAAGWLDQEDLWLVSKRTIDALRDHLQQEGHTDIPSRNDRVFDVLQEHALLKPNGEQAIWRAKVSDSTGEWSHELTLLRIPTHRIWPNQEAAPEPFAGSISPASKDGAPEVSVKKVIEHQTGPSSPDDEPPHTQDETEIDDGTMPIPINQPRPLEKLPPEGNMDAGEEFLSWLQAGLASGNIIINDVRARVHVVPEGVLIVSPAIFKDFANHSTHEWNHVQKRFQKLNLHEKTPQGTNIHSYRTTGGRKQSTVNGLLLRDHSVLFQTTIPHPNPHLSKK